MNNVKQKVDEISQELSDQINPHWDNLRQIHHGYVAIHTWLVIWWAKNHLPHLFDALDDDEQNIILWACLLHDIRKLGWPIFEGKDHVHPFKSAAAVLEVFNQLGILDVS
jgi:hypothetical protein